MWEYLKKYEHNTIFEGYEKYDYIFYVNNTYQVRVPNNERKEKM